MRENKNSNFTRNAMLRLASFGCGAALVAAFERGDGEKQRVDLPKEVPPAHQMQEVPPAPELLSLSETVEPFESKKSAFDSNGSPPESKSSSLDIERSPVGDFKDGSTLEGRFKHITSLAPGGSLRAEKFRLMRDLLEHFQEGRFNASDQEELAFQFMVRFYDHFESEALKESPSSILDEKVRIQYLFLQRRAGEACSRPDIIEKSIQMLCLHEVGSGAKFDSYISAAGRGRSYSPNELLLLMTLSPSVETKQNACNAFFESVFLPSNKLHESGLGRADAATTSLLYDAAKVMQQGDMVLPRVTDQGLRPVHTVSLLSMIQAAREREDRPLLEYLSEPLRVTDVTKEGSTYQIHAFQDRLLEEYMVARIGDNFGAEDQLRSVSFLCNKLDSSLHWMEKRSLESQLVFDRLYRLCKDYELYPKDLSSEITSELLFAAERHGDSDFYQRYRPSVFGYQLMERFGMTRERFGDRVYYTSFSRTPFDRLIAKPVPLPHDFPVHLYLADRVKDSERFRAQVTHLLKKVTNGNITSLEEIRSLPVGQVMSLAVSIVAEGIDYYLIDDDPRYEKLREPEDIFAHGLGDCDKYAACFIEVVELFKEIHPRLVNVHVCNSHGPAHVWNRIQLVFPESVVVTEVDVTFFDSRRNKLQSQLERLESHDKDWKDREAFLRYFYRGIE